MPERDADREMLAPTPVPRKPQMANQESSTSFDLDEFEASELPTASCFPIEDPERESDPDGILKPFEGQG